MTFRWEYMKTYGELTELRLNEFGLLGWELVCLVPSTNMMGGPLWIFKRQSEWTGHK